MQLVYSRPALCRDLLRAVVGLAVSLVVLAVGPVPIIGWQAGGCAILFLAFGLRSMLRLRTVVEIDDSGIALVPRGTRIDWRALERITLRYFPGRRDGSDGWLELRLAGDGRRMILDQALDGFESVLARAEHAARENGLRLSAVTEANLAAHAMRSAR